ncbi:hypothetical protein GCM10009730_57260 [Streptomyces albidochromogenes]|uniref:hypothetical protein n=1 Tax=Streptomyces albidochromogenes TaxID=329524 RepID=UPI00110FAC34|nr:hypothetical protein [Streptomyces albidochromogenes]
MDETVDKKWHDRKPSPRGVVLAVLGVVTLGVAILSVAVSYDILEPKFGAWAVPTVGALDALWVVFQATEMLAGNNRARARRVQYAGLVLTAVNAAIPTADLIMSRAGGFDLAVVLTPIAIVATKTAWWLALPSLGRKVSADTQQHIDAKRQLVSDKLEEMEAEAAHRVELLQLATELEKRVAKAETAYRKSVLKTQQIMTEKLHGQAEATAKTVTEKVLPPSVAAISLPALGEWAPTAPALPGTADRALPGTAAIGRHTPGTQVNAGAQGNPSRQAARTGTLEEIAAVTGVPVPVPGEPLTNAQLAVALRHLRYSDDPPLSYRQARDSFRRAGFVGSEERVRQEWSALRKNEGTGEEADESEEEDAGA